MELKINRYASMLKPSLIREMKVLADKYNDVIDFTLGEPHISRHTYEVIQEGLHHKMMESSLGYSHQYGIIETEFQSIVSIITARFMIHIQRLSLQQVFLNLLVRFLKQF